MNDFFFKCWLTFKEENPRLRKRMDEMEFRQAEEPEEVPAPQYTTPPVNIRDIHAPEIEIAQPIKKHNQTPAKPPKDETIHPL